MMFSPYQTASKDMIIVALKVAVITSVLVSLAATKAMSEKKLEFFRESSSGYDRNAYFVAINITSTIEHSIQMVLAGFVCAVIRNPLTSWFAFIGNFVMLGWVSVSWALLFGVILPTKNLVVFTGFFMASCGILVGGAIPPIEYKDIYSSYWLMAFSGLFSPTRLFIENFVVNDYKCLQEQTGFTQCADAIQFPEEFQSFNVTKLGQLDKKIHIHSCDGWFWNFFPSFLIGLTIRFYAGILMHVVNRPQQNEPPLKKVLSWNLFKSCRKVQFVAFLMLLLPVLTLCSIIMER
mmetsp:Transcript_42187/g.98893  ORF Transcript_42187/g.98893 Transcript_42187/m.98893 type:complete len:292 (-) Transcript_42187:55-930(-)